MSGIIGLGLLGIRKKIPRTIACILFCFTVILLYTAPAYADGPTTIYIGDGLAQIIHGAVGDDGNKWICDDKGNAEWLVSVSEELDKLNIVDENIVVMLGEKDVKDMSMVEVYVEWLKKTAEKYKDATVFYVSINPVKEQEPAEGEEPDASKVTNNDILQWNDNM